MPKVSIIIVTYNAMKWAERCFSSLRKSSVPLNCIVVDNGSEDGTQEFIKTNFPEIEFMQSVENVGFGKANNMGIEKAYQSGAEFFYLMNQDAWIFEDTFEKLLKVYSNHPRKEEIGILSPMHLDGSEQKLDFHFERYLGKNTVHNSIISDLYLGNVQAFYEVDFVNAAHWLLPRKTIAEIGGFNPYIFHYGEDFEYVNRVRFRNLKILVSAESKVVHDAVQGFYKNEPKTKKEMLTETRISARKQRENRYFDPAYDFDLWQEKKEFISNMIKLALKGKLEESRYHYQLYQFFLKRFPAIIQKRNLILNEKHPFLNL
ncbi:glycosyltransferase family 2 protein [Chryseobacterium sp. R2A-55]|uniref:glycosyltransferase family 2 protein n=1 Tax=Chryseobacterium sp. R2A-55 TaxID=2744445 RepID=UPI001F332DF6|nr:glycosyltransferase family 2 protein [Chryseobacterium sp. R2A-55]